MTRKFSLRTAIDARGLTHELEKLMQLILKIQEDIKTELRVLPDEKRSALYDIAEERARQIGSEGFTPMHDDEHDEGELARAAACYAYSSQQDDAILSPPFIWPLSRQWWKPKGSRRDLIRAGALIVAEIERLDRLTMRKSEAFDDPFGSDDE